LLLSSLPFPAELKFLGAIPAKQASLSALEKRRMSPISAMSLLATALPTPGRVVSL